MKQAKQAKQTKRTTQPHCPFQVGDHVRFTPSERTCGLYQDIEHFGVAPGKVFQIKSIKDGVYLYFGGDKGGWPWNEFQPCR
jgi:hypothetical protein